MSRPKFLILDLIIQFILGLLTLVFLNTQIGILFYLPLVVWQWIISPNKHKIDGQFSWKVWPIFANWFYVGLIALFIFLNPFFIYGIVLTYGQMSLFYWPVFFSAIYFGLISLQIVPEMSQIIPDKKSFFKLVDLIAQFLAIVTAFFLISTTNNINDSSIFSLNDKLGSSLFCIAVAWQFGTALNTIRYQWRQIHLYLSWASFILLPIFLITIPSLLTLWPIFLYFSYLLIILIEIISQKSL